MVTMIRRLKKSARFILPLPALISLVLFAIVGTGCREDASTVSGELKILYSTDVGGAIDPCG